MSLLQPLARWERAKPVAIYSNFNGKTYNLAKLYLDLKRSVIPCHPNSKIAATAWKSFQLRRADDAQLSQWFAQDTNYNIGIVTGQISNLIVLDIDAQTLLTRFLQQFPHLRLTPIVRTGRGWHIYLTPPAGVYIRSRKGRGIDLQAEGSYVLAPPSRVNGHEYKMLQGGAPIEISVEDLERILAVFSDFFTETVDNTQTAEKPLKTALSASNGHLHTRLSLSGLKHRYQRLAGEMGRNNALFSTACLGRDLGYTPAEVKRALVDAHVQQPANDAHVRETEASRIREAQRTIASAFSRSPRPLRQNTLTFQLSNRIREAMLHRKLMGQMRVVEGLRLKGIEPNDIFTRNDALELLDGIVGRDTIYAAFHTEVDGAKIFQEIPPDPPVLRCYTHMSEDNQKMLFDRGPKSGITHFRMPSNAELVRILGVESGYTSDELTLEDLKSVKTVREQLTHGFIERKPGQYSRATIAALTNVSISTYKRYMRALKDVQVTPVFSAEPVNWGNLEGVIPPDDVELQGVFLVDNYGTHYPAKVAIARKLLAKKRRVELHRQRANHYKVVETTYSRQPDAIVPDRTWGVMPMIQYIERPTVNKRVDIPLQEPLAGLETPSRVGDDIPTLDKEPDESGKRKLKDADKEHLAQHVYTTINAMTKNPEDKMSLRSARLMVLKYGVKAVGWALKRVQQRRNVRKPVGLLSTILRSESKFGR